MLRRTAVAVLALAALPGCLSPASRVVAPRVQGRSAAHGAQRQAAYYPTFDWIRTRRLPDGSVRIDLHYFNPSGKVVDPLDCGIPWQQAPRSWYFRADVESPTGWIKMACGYCRDIEVRSDGVSITGPQSMAPTIASGVVADTFHCSIAITYAEEGTTGPTYWVSGPGLTRFVGGTAVPDGTPPRGHD